jgi:hypothetical protein
MMLSEITLPMEYEACRSLAMVYPYEVAALWYQMQAEHGDPRHIGSARPTNDGRWVLNGDILSELHPGGIFAWSLPYLTPEIQAAIEVVPMAEIEPLIVRPEITEADYLAATRPEEVSP